MADESSKLSRGIPIGLLAFLFFAVASSLVWNFQGKFPTIQIIFIQNIISLLCVLPLALRRGIRHLKTSFLPIHLVRDVFGVVSYFFYFLAIRYLNLVDATTLNYTAPFFVPFVWRFWMQEKIAPSVWWAIVIGFAGVAVILKPTADIFQSGFTYGICAGISSAIALAAVRIVNLKKEPLLRTLFYYFFIGSIASLPFACSVWVHPTGIEWFLAIGIGIATAIGQIFLTIAYRYGTASYLSPLGYATVIYTAVISWLIFNKPLTFRSFLGTALIVLGGTLTFFFRQKKHTIKAVFEAPPSKEKPPKF